MAFCSNCGGRYEEGANYCPTCGRPLRSGVAGVASAGTVASRAEVVTPRVRTRIPGYVKAALGPDESVLGAFNASLFDHRKQGLSLAHDKFVLTPQRLVMYHTGLVHKGMGEIPYRQITEVSSERGLFHGRVIVEAANAGLTLDGIGNDDATFAEKIIAGGIAGRTYATTGPLVEPPRISALVPIVLFIILLAVVALVVFAAPLLSPLH